MLSTAQIDGMRDTLDRSLPDTAVRLTWASTGDGQGGQVDAWTAASAVWPCRISPNDAQPVEEERGGAMRAAAGWILTIPHASGITEADRVRITTTDGSTFDYIVRGVGDRRTWQLCVRVEVDRVEAV